MDLIPKSTVSLHLIDENFLFADDIREKYSWKNKYQVRFYPTFDKFLKDISKKPLPGKGPHIIILAVQLALPDRQVSADLVNRVISLRPGADIIKICHDKEPDAGVPAIRHGNVIHIINNDNTLLRIDNAIKWVLAKKNIENKIRRFRLALVLLLASLAVSAIAIIMI